MASELQPTAKDLRIYDREDKVVTQGAFNALMAHLDSLEEDLECVTAERDNRQRELDEIYASALAAPTPVPWPTDEETEAILREH